MLFEYGGHSNATLFAEYGFCEVPEAEEDDKWLLLKNGELDVGWIVDKFWEEEVKKNSNEEDAAEKQKALEAIACWGYVLLLFTLHILNYVLGTGKTPFILAQVHPILRILYS